MGKDGGADVAAVHYDAFLLSHKLLLARHSLAHKGQGRHRADAVAYLHAPDFLFHHFAAEARERLARLFVEAEGNGHARHQAFQARSVEASICLKATILHGEKRYGAVHRAGINIDIACFAGELFGHGAFAA